MTKYGGYLGVIMVYIVAASPFLGGYFETSYGWRTSFLAVLLYGLLLFILAHQMLPETNLAYSITRLKTRYIWSSYKKLVTSPVFMGCAFCVFLTYGAFFSWFVVGPVLCVLYFNLDPESFGVISLALGGASMAIGGVFNARYVSRIGQDMMLRLGWGIIISSGLLMLVLEFFSYLSLFPFFVCLFAFLFGATLIWPNSFSKAFAPFGSIAGYAGSLYGAMQLGGGAIIGWMSAFIPDNKVYPLAIVFLVTAISAWLIFETFVKQKNQIIK
jgi:DHA1 family bicyclomycin/chloramphenicol resistance-like MFS transporter/DHA1 family 2-module integral membrane pump EmrD-like MFS transporter